MDNIKDIIEKLSKNLLFIELINLLKKNKKLKNIINDNFYNIFSIIEKINFKIENINNLPYNDIILINDLINNKSNDLTSLLEVKKEKEKIDNILNIIFIIQKLLLIVSILIYIYLIYDLFVNKTDTNIDNYLHYLKMLSYVIIFTHIISLKNSIFAIKNYLINNFPGLPILAYIMIFQQILIFLLNKHELIIKSTNDYRYIIVIVILIIACILYNIYRTTKHTKTSNPIANIELSSYIFDKYSSKLNTDFINKTLNMDFNKTLSAGINQTLSAGINKTLSAGINQTLSAGINKTLSTNINKDLNTGINKYFANLF